MTDAAPAPDYWALAPVVGLLVLILGLTGFAGPLSDLTMAIADDLLDPAGQAHAVLGGGGQ